MGRELRETLKELGQPLLGVTLVFGGLNFMAAYAEAWGALVCVPLAVIVVIGFCILSTGMDGGYER